VDDCFRGRVPWEPLSCCRWTISASVQVIGTWTAATLILLCCSSYLFLGCLRFVSLLWLRFVSRLWLRFVSRLWLRFVSRLWLRFVSRLRSLTRDSVCKILRSCRTAGLRQTCHGHTHGSHCRSQHWRPASETRLA
jgi:hypothetical protein